MDIQKGCFYAQPVVSNVCGKMQFLHKKFSLSTKKPEFKAIAMNN